MMAIPVIFKKTLLGVLQIMNKVEGGAFTGDDLENASQIGKVFAEKFRYDMNTEKGDRNV